MLAMSEVRVDGEVPRDVLTGLPGLEAVRMRLAEWQRDTATGSHVHAALLGLRRFDAIKLTYGVPVSDAALAEVAARISHFASEELDGPFIVARSGGNFLLVANEACSRERWQLFAEQLADAVARPIPLPVGMLRLSPRMSLVRCGSGSVESMLHQLEQSLATIKRQPSGRIAWADGEATRPGRTAMQLEEDLLGAIERDEIEVLYQPQFSLPDDRLSGAEALARWNHPMLGRIGASALFSIAERARQTAPLSRHIARAALAGAREWPEHLRLSLNVTPADLAVAQFGQGLLGIVGESDFPPGRLTLELTEQAILADIQLAGRTLREIAAQGIRIGLDDFGAGFCNFRYLKLLPLHYLKLDRSMVSGIVEDARDLAVLRAIVAMAKALDLTVIAEGVESEGQRLLVSAEGCDFYQGFLRAQPMSAEDFWVLASK
jgi:EAL domain-containing protein (putative c-di-GMP-specific phosphodiesterase class I)/GGDEF domain-containing protein